MLMIKDELIKKMYSSNLTKFELITLIELIKISNEEGIANIYYKEMVEAIGCNTATFYNVIKSLEKKEFIETDKDIIFKKEIVVGVYNNNFKDDYSNYVKIDNVFFGNNIYKDLPAGEIRIMLYLLFRIAKQKYSPDKTSYYHDKNKMFYKSSYPTIANSLKITMRMLKQYMKSLIKRKIIVLGEQIDIKLKKYDVVTVAKSFLKEYIETATEKGKKIVKKVNSMQLHYKNCIKNFCRRNKIKIMDMNNLNDTAILMIQYIKQAEKSNKNIYTLINTAIKNLRNNILESKNVHYVLKALLNKDYDEGIVIY